MDENQQKKPDFNEYDATLETEEVKRSDDELQDSILDDSNMTGFQRYIAKMDEAKWTFTQRIAGALMGIAAGVALFWQTGEQNSKSFISIPLLIALIIALWLPNIIEKKGQRKAPKLRIAMVIALGVVIVAFFLITGFKNGFKFSNTEPTPGEAPAQTEAAPASESSDISENTAEATELPQPSEAPETAA